MRLFDHMRERLLFAAGVHEPPKFKDFADDLEVSLPLLLTNWSTEFETLMRNRLAMGALRYGMIGHQKAKQSPFDVAGAVLPKLRAYHLTGNTEYLVDAANYLMLVFCIDPHPTKHFSALDDHTDHCKLKK